MRIAGVLALVVVAACSFHGRDSLGADAPGADGASGGIDSSTVSGPDARLPDAGSPDAFVCTAEDGTSACVAGGACLDGIDNDADGRSDCLDTGCAGICGLSLCCPDGSCATLLIFCP